MTPLHMTKAAILALVVMFLPLGGICQDISEMEAKLHTLTGDRDKINLLIDLGEYYCSRDHQKALFYLQDALVLSTNLGYRKGVAGSLLWQGRSFYYKDEYAMAMRYLEKARHLYKELDDPDGLANVYGATGAIHRILGNHLMAIQDYQKVIDLSELSGNMEKQTAGFMSLGGFYNERGEPEQALAYLTQALALAKHTGNASKKAIVLANMGLAHEHLNNLDSALVYMDKGLRIQTELEEVRGIASSKYNIGGLLIKMNQPRQAVETLKQAVGGFSLLDDDTGICIATIQLAQAWHLAGNNAEALDNADAALDIARKINNPALIKNVLKVLAHITSGINKHELAYAYLLRHNKIHDSLADANREQLIRELEIQFQTARKESEIQILKSRNEMQRKNNLLLSISSVALVVILLLGIILMRQKSRGIARKNKLFEQEKTIHKQKEALRDQEQQVMNEQLEAKNRELASKALEMTRVNEVISSIIEKLEAYSNENQENEKSTYYISGIISGLEAQLKKNSWSEFEKVFKQIHSGFYKKLLDICPDLSPAEIKVAAFLKLNLNTKEIAAISYKSESGIKSTRYRLRKKLGLASDDSLIPFLMKL